MKLRAGTVASASAVASDTASVDMVDVASVSDTASDTAAIEAFHLATN